MRPYMNPGELARIRRAIGRRIAECQHREWLNHGLLANFTDADALSMGRKMNARRVQAQKLIAGVRTPITRNQMLQEDSL